MALVFDFDGVIVDTRTDNIEAINQLARKYRFDPLDEAAYGGMLTCNFYEYWQMLLGPRAESFLTDLRHMQRPTATVLPGMAEMLEAHQPAIVSSNYTALIENCLAVHSIRLPVYGGDIEKSKVRKLNRLKSATDVFVTDTVGDLLEGRRAGYTLVAVTWGFNTKEMLLQAEPHHVVETPEELHDVLVSLLQEEQLVTLHR